MELQDISFIKKFKGMRISMVLAKYEDLLYSVEQ